MQISAARVSVGDVLAGKYRIERVLGEGGMGLVVEASHLGLDQRVAIKLMLPELLTNQEAVVRFMREGRAAAKIKSEHVVRVFDVDSLPSGEPYIVMEMLDGRDLAVVLDEARTLGVEDAVDFVLQACEVVAEAHALGIVHRDLKPSNLFCVDTGGGTTSIKVLDFGISKLTQMHMTDSGLGVTNTAAVMGSPLYMSPEQLHSARDVDGRTDIWALGVILYQLLTGHTPFTGSSQIEIGVRIVTTPAVALRTHRAEVPARLEAIVHRCLEKDPAARFASVREFGAALAEFAPARSRPSLDRIARSRGEPGSGASVALTPRSGDLAPSGDGQRPPVSATMTAMVPSPLAVALPTQVSSHASTNPTKPSAGNTAPPWDVPPKKRGRASLVGALGLGGVALVVLGVLMFTRGSLPKIDGGDEKARNGGGVGITPIAAPTTAAADPATGPAAPTASTPSPIADPAASEKTSPIFKGSSEGLPPPEGLIPEPAPAAALPAASARSDHTSPVRKNKVIAKPPPLVPPTVSAPEPNETKPKNTVWEERK